MFELVPSKDMREHFEKVGFTFTDFQKATLIWNVPEKTLQERCDALRELAETTEDENTRTQILERLEACRHSQDDDLDEEYDAGRFEN